MITVPSIVSDIIRRNAYIEEALSREVLNLSGLARDMQREVEERTMKDVEIGSIVMALKRLTPHAQQKARAPSVFKQNPELIIRSQLCEITIANSVHAIDTKKKLLVYAGDHSEHFITITHGVFETTIIMSADAFDDISKILKNDTVVYELKNISSITIKFPQSIIDIPGVYYMILKVLAWEGIEIAEVVSTFSEFTIILKEEYVERAFGLIKKLFSPAEFQK